MSQFSLQVATRQSQNLATKMMMTRQMQRNLTLLTASVQQLQHEITQEIEENPALEIIEEKNKESIDSIKTNKNKGEDSKRKFEFVESLLTVPETLAEHLEWQLQMENISERKIEIGKVLIENLDENGFFIESPYVVCKTLNNANKEEVDEVISIIQELDPFGCATMGVTDSLRVQLNQLELNDQIDELHKKQLETCFQHIDKALANPHTNIAHIKKTMDDYLSDEEFQEYLHLLIPYPGRAYAHNHIDRELYVIPDAMVTIANDELVVKINQEIVPILTLSKSISDLTNSEDKKAKKLASEWVGAAESFIKGIEYRNSTLEKVILYIAHYQREFFLGINDYLKPFTQQELAQALDLNISTISRIISNKYIQTSRGIYELKFFFSHRMGLKDTSGQQLFHEITLLIDILKQKKEKISDRIISEKLAEKGIKVARRTVSKYRKQIEEDE